MFDRSPGEDDDSEPAALPQELPWSEGSDSPTGRRVLDVRPASGSLLSASAEPEAVRNVMETPTNLDELASGVPGYGWSTSVEWTFDEAELLRIRAGFAPSAMEDKWRILAREVKGTLRVYFRRSWTNELVFVAEIEGGRTSRLSHLKEAFSPGLTARAVLDGYLLGRTCVIPAPRALGTDKRRLMSYGISVAGRHCDFVEPEAARTWFVSMDDPQIRWVYKNPNAVDRQFPRFVTDESMSSRFRFTHSTLVRATAAMLRPDRAEAVANGVIPTEDAGLDHDELARLRGWLSDSTRT